MEYEIEIQVSISCLETSSPFWQMSPDRRNSASKTKPPMTALIFHHSRPSAIFPTTCTTKSYFCKLHEDIQGDTA